MGCRCVGPVEVTVYNLPASAEGQQVRQFFASKGIPYEEFDAAVDPQALLKLGELSGQVERPAVIVDGQLFVGFDRSQLESAVPSLF